METGKFVAGIVASMFLASCASMGAGGDGARMAHKEKAKECDGNGACFVEVKTTDDGSRIVIDPDYVIVNNKRKPIQIFLNPTGNLVIEAVDFGNTGGEFEPCTAVGSTGQFRCSDKHTTFGVYKYSVKVKNFAQVDPWIVND